jgi:hypothetical protein
MQKHTPYDTGKVKIGLLYTSPPPETTPESDWIQGVLLGDRRGLSELTLVTIQSIGLMAFIIIGIFLIGGNTNA